jgi:hypothetical protein
MEHEIIDEVVQEQVTNNGYDQQEEISQTEQQVGQQASGQPSKQAENFRKLREKNEQLDRERQEALAEIERLRKLHMSKPAARKNNYEDEESAQEMHSRDWNARIAQLEEATIESRLRAQFPDFDAVVNNDTISRLRTEDPELAESIHYNPNLYSKAVAVYKAIKKNNIYQPDTYQKEREQAQTNAHKPRSTQSISPQQGDTPLSRANAFSEGLTEELKAQLRKEMFNARKNL